MGNDVSVIGFKWCKTQSKKIGLSSLTAKILCARHNSLLSDTDNAAMAAFDALRQCQRLSGDIEKGLRQFTPVIKFEINGIALERWMLKTLINITLVTESAVPWANRNGNSTDLPNYLVRTAFGQEVFGKPRGLYFAATVGQKEHSSDEFSFAPLIHHQTELNGGIFSFRGHRLLLYFGSNTLPSKFDLPSAGPLWAMSALRYHLKRMQWTYRDHRTHYIEYKWP
jgi:hypothetical protein